MARSIEGMKTRDDLAINELYTCRIGCEQLQHKN